jgi:hypothetical protein
LLCGRKKIITIDPCIFGHTRRDQG